MKLKDYILKEETEEQKAEKQVKLAKNSAERQIIELECDLEEKRQEKDDLLRENFDLLQLVELEQDIAVMEDLLERAKEKMEELF